MMRTDLLYYYYYIIFCLKEPLYYLIILQTFFSAIKLSIFLHVSDLTPLLLYFVCFIYRNTRKITKHVSIERYGFKLHKFIHKTRCRNHLKSLRNENYKRETKLSKHIWNLKNENRQFSIRWAIVKQVPAVRNGKRNCTLCLEEKLLIMKGRLKNIHNRRSEMLSKCRYVM